MSVLDAWPFNHLVGTGSTDLRCLIHIIVHEPEMVNLVQMIDDLLHHVVHCFGVDFEVAVVSE